MAAPRLTQVTAISENRYRAVFASERSEVTVQTNPHRQAARRASVGERWAARLAGYGRPRPR